MTQPDIITLWVKSGKDKFGKPGWVAPTTIEGHWEDIESLDTDEGKREVVSKARVHVSSDVNEGDYLFLGTSVAVDPTLVTDAFEIKGVKKIRSILSATSFSEIVASL